MSLASWWFNKIISGDDEDLSKYILQASFDDRLKSDEGFLSAAGDLAALTAASGKDLYLTAAKVVFFANTNSSGTADEVVIKINGTVVETVKNSWLGGSGSGEYTLDYEFKNMGHKVEATQVMKLELISIGAATDVEGFIQAIEVPTGENPTTYANP